MWSGLLLTLVIAIVASGAARFVPLVGAPVLAILIGILVRSRVAIAPRFDAGVHFAAKFVLQAAVVVSGFGLSFALIVRTGLATLPVTLVTIAVALVAAPLIGRALKVDAGVRTLVGVGTAICGASAIAAIASVTEAADADVALAVATIFAYNIAAVVLFPPLGHLLHLGQAAFGVWAGTAINDTSSVVAAGYAYGHDAGTEATVVKLTRATLILPIAGAIAIPRARSRAGGAGAHPIAWHRIVPWFILWFLVAALIDTTGAIAPAWHAPIALLATFLITVALAGIGLQTNLRTLAAAGARPLLLGGALWMLVALTSLAMQHATGT